MKFAIRADASLAIGTGHVRRMLALAHALRACGGDISFVCRDLGIDTGTMVRAEGFAHIQLAAPSFDHTVTVGRIGHVAWAGVSQDVDATQTLLALADLSPQWVVVDHYSFDATWHRTVRSALGCRIAVVDDLADRELECDLLIDHNYCENHSAKYAGRIERKAHVLGGPRFALLGPEYADVKPRVVVDTVSSIGIFMGGVDANNVTSTVLNALDELEFQKPLEVVTTSANPNLSKLQRRASQRLNTSLVLDLPSLVDFFGRHDLHIGGGGGATWERACIGAPTLGIAVARNQLESLIPMAFKRCLVAVDMTEDKNPTAVAEAISALCSDHELRHDLAKNAQQLVDGRGAVRVALRCMVDALYVRPAGDRDSAMMFAWRNHSATRAVSVNNTEIVWEDHVRWFDGVLQTPSCLLLVAQIGAIPVGVIRFDNVSMSRCQVSLYLDPQLHGLGLGKAMLLAGEDQLESDVSIDAHVVTGNTPSSRLFASAGYTAKDPNNWFKNRGEAKIKTEGTS